MACPNSDFYISRLCCLGRFVRKLLQVDYFSLLFGTLESEGYCWRCSCLSVVVLARALFLSAIDAFFSNLQLQHAMEVTNIGVFIIFKYSLNTRRKPALPATSLFACC